jgi:hypothetical protein
VALIAFDALGGFPRQSACIIIAGRCATTVEQVEDAGLAHQFGLMHMVIQFVVNIVLSGNGIAKSQNMIGLCLATHGIFRFTPDTWRGGTIGSIDITFVTLQEPPENAGGFIALFLGKIIAIAACSISGKAVII